MDKDDFKTEEHVHRDVPAREQGTEIDVTGEPFLTACETLSSERYQAFVDNIQEGVYEVDLDGNYLYFNEALCRIYGYPRDEIHLQNFSRFMEPGEAQKAYEAFNRIYHTGQGFTDILWKIKRKDGGIRFVELSASLITNADGDRVGFRGVARDITERFKTQEALRKSERRYRALLDFAPYPIVDFTLDGRVSYLNPAFTDTFGWTLAELAGKRIPYVPPDLKEETADRIRKLLQEKMILRHETRRLTKDGRILDVVMRGAVYAETSDEPGGQLVILRDITHEKRMARNNEAMLRISMALPAYPDLEDLLDFISGEIKQLLDVEGALVILLDEERNELYFKSAAHDDLASEESLKEIRWPANKGVSGKVIRTGKPVIVPDTSKEPHFYSVVDLKAGFKTLNMLDVPLRSGERIIGVLCAMNKKRGTFDRTDAELLNMIGGTVALTIENARYSTELKEAYNEVTSLNRAKDKVINHLSHELKTPLSVLKAALNILSKRLSALPEETWHPTLERAQRNLERILELQYRMEDIIRERRYEAYDVLSRLLEECADELESLVAETYGEGEVVEKIRRRIDEIFAPKETPPERLHLHEFIPPVLDEIRPLFAHREVDLRTRFEATPAIKMPADALRKVVVGLVRNAIENTPDEGKVEVVVRKRGPGAELQVRDYGVGITPENQRRIFEGFFTTRDTMDYSSKRPYDFNAGGKGADLLRMKIFSERFNFKIEMVSSRCEYLPSEKDRCPGRISQCQLCSEKGSCHRFGGTTFIIFFPAARGDSP